MALPTLIVVSGPPGTGKTTLAHALARAIGCPAICRDEIKEGLAHAVPGYRASVGDSLTVKASATFFAVLGVLVDQGVTVVAEAAFQDRVWRPALEPIRPRAAIRVVRCAAPHVARERMRQRLEVSPASRSAHADHELGGPREQGSSKALPFVAVSLDVPTLDVDTTAGYQPSFDTIVAFARADTAARR